MNRKIIFAMGLLSLMLAGTSIPATQGATAVKIGLLTPKTGPLGVLGQTFEDGAKLAIKDLNAMQSDYTFELVVQDTKTDPNGAADAMTALATAGVSGVVGAAASSSTLAAMPIAKQNKIPIISYASTSPSISTSDDDDYLFRVVPSDAYQGQVAADLAWDSGYKKIGIIAINDAYGQGLSGAFKTAYIEHGGSVVQNIAYEVTDQDFTSRITTIGDAGVDAIFMVSFVDDGGLILDAIAANADTKDLPVLGTDGIASDGVYGAVSNPENFVGVKGVAPELASNSTFNTKYNAEYGEDPSVFVPESYDATMLIGKAVIAADSTTGSDVKDELRETAAGFEGFSTGTIKFDDNGDRLPPFTYSVWEAGAYPSANLTTIDTVSISAPVEETTKTSSSSTSEGSPINFFMILTGLTMFAILDFVRKLRK